MSEPTQEQLRTEAYWRSTIEREVYDEADRIEREPESRSLGVALAGIVRHVGNKVGQMPDRDPMPSGSYGWSCSCGARSHPTLPLHAAEAGAKSHAAGGA